LAFITPDQKHKSGQTQYAKEHGQYYQFEGKESGREGIVTALQNHNDYLHIMP